MSVKERLDNVERLRDEAQENCDKASCEDPSMYGPEDAKVQAYTTALAEMVAMLKELREANKGIRFSNTNIPTTTDLDAYLEEK